MTGPVRSPIHAAPPPRVRGEGVLRALRRCLNIDDVPGGKGFFARQGGLTPKYLVYFKSNQRHMAEKDLSFGHVGNFQTSPKPFPQAPARGNGRRRMGRPSAKAGRQRGAGTFPGADFT